MAVTEKAQRRTELLQRAAQLFSERGYHGTSMQHLAEAMGILRGSLYAHITSKEDLLFDIVEWGADRFITRMEEVLASEADPEEKVRMAIAAHVETVAEHMEASTVFLNDWKFLSDDRRSEILAKRDLYESLVGEIIEEGIEWEVFPADLDPRFATLLILSTVNWVYQWYNPQGALSSQEIARVFSDMILNGIKSRD